ncbi:MAG: flagellar hook-associated protein 3 [Gammaproteobacteria bacterium 39-13]|nr:flagellar hook-associated protein FlgL [Gammaproteobacteria bacterium]OJV86601.1 MAG: flagellar hook-associated protein 3 [Gammaproteobacteria bacterium 39-13]
MRISTVDIYLNAINNFEQQQLLLNDTENKISVGKRIIVASDDPIGATQAINLRYQMNKFDQFIKNSTTAENALEYEDSILDAVTSLYQRLIELTIQAGNTVLVDSDRNAIAVEMTERLQELTDLVNERSANGDYLFSGFDTNIMPVIQDTNGVYHFRGDEGQRDVMLGTSTFVAISDSGKEIFFNIPTQRINGSGNDGLATVTSPASSLVTAGTVPPIGPNDLIISQIAIPAPILDGVSTSDAASSALAIANAINSQYVNHKVRAVANATQVDLGIYTPGTIGTNEFVINGIEIIDTGGTEASLMSAISAMASQSGVTVSQPGGPGTNMMLSAADGRNIQLQTLGTSPAATFANFNLTAGTLDQVMVGTVSLRAHQDFSIGGALPSAAGFSAGIYPLSTNTGTGIISQPQVIDNIADPTQTYSIIFNAGGTTFNIVSDADPTTPLAGFANVTYAPGKTISFNGISLNITGIPNGGDVFGVSLVDVSTQDIFTSIQQIIKNITSYSSDPVQFSYEIGLGLNNLYDAQNVLIKTRTLVGARLNVVESAKGFNETLKLLSQKNLSLIEDLDYSQAITKLTQTSFALQAAMQSFVQIQNLNIFAFLR